MTCRVLHGKYGCQPLGSSQFSLQQEIRQQWIRVQSERIGYGDAVASEALLQVLCEEKAASALGGRGKDHAMPKTAAERGSSHDVTNILKLQTNERSIDEYS